MPARQPFTSLCRTVAQLAVPHRADLHVHSTHSDGAYTPAQVVDLAARSGLAAVALTDHDTTTGIAEARAAARPCLEVVPGVEITAEHDGRDMHLLGYFFDPDHGPLVTAIRRLRDDRAGRFHDMAARLRSCGVALDDGELAAEIATGSVGRRNLAALLVKAGHCGSLREAFARYLHSGGRANVPAPRLPLAEAIALVRGAGGVAAWAHPTYDCNRETLAALHAVGLQALEVDYPTHRPGRVRSLRALATEVGLAVTGGSDCHGPDEPRRAVGVRGVSRAELDALRQLAGP